MQQRCYLCTLTLAHPTPTRTRCCCCCCCQDLEELLEEWQPRLRPRSYSSSFSVHGGAWWSRAAFWRRESFGSNDSEGDSGSSDAISDAGTAGAGNAGNAGNAGSIGSVPNTAAGTSSGTRGAREEGRPQVQLVENSIRSSVSSTSSTAAAAVLGESVGLLSAAAEVSDADVTGASEAVQLDSCAPLLAADGVPQGGAFAMDVPSHFQQLTVLTGSSASPGLGRTVRRREGPFLQYVFAPSHA